MLYQVAIGGHPEISVVDFRRVLASDGRDILLTPPPTVFMTSLESPHCSVNNCPLADVEFFVF